MRLLLLFLAWPALVLAQASPTESYRLGLLSPATLATLAPRVEAFKKGLDALGYREGKNVAIEYRWGEGKGERLPELARELAALKVSILLAHGAQAAIAARNAGGTIPIVCLACGDVIATGLVKDLARPGGRITGLTAINPAMSGKRLELLKEMVPGLTRVGILWNSRNPVSTPEVKETEAAAMALGLKVQSLPVSGAEGIRNAFAALGKERAQALVILSDAMFVGRRRMIAELALEQRVPSIAWTGELARDGLLMGYGADYDALYRQAAVYVDKVLRGAKPADLPIEQPTKFEFVLNLRTAQVLGLTIPQYVRALANDVVQ